MVRELEVDAQDYVLALKTPGESWMRVTGP